MISSSRSTITKPSASKRCFLLGDFAELMVVCPLSLCFFAGVTGASKTSLEELRSRFSVGLVTLRGMGRGEESIKFVFSVVRLGLIDH
jgi:hypothetical protein